MKQFFKQIGANDLWLTLFFFATFTNLIFSMIFPVPNESNKLGLDVTMRTATAVLSGYFISKNFIEKKPNIQTQSIQYKKYEITRTAFQTILVGLIGLFSFSVLTLVRYANTMQFFPTTLSQMRDLYLASVAFLMGTSQT